MHNTTGQEHGASFIAMPCRYKPISDIGVGSPEIVTAAYQPELTVNLMSSLQVSSSRSVPE